MGEPREAAVGVERVMRSSCLIAILLLIVLVAALLPDAHAGPDDVMVSKFVGKNWVNGRSWNKLEYPGKLGYVCGLFDGATLFFSMADNMKSIKREVLHSVYTGLSIPSSMTVGDVVKGMDEFYLDPENVPLPAICAYMHFVYKARGDNDEAISKRVKTWRKMFSH